VFIVVAVTEQVTHRCDRLLPGKPEDPHLRERLMDCEDDRTLRAVLVEMLRETDRGR
jgi:hypothetical protein